MQLYTIRKFARIEQKIKKSKFIASAFPVSTEDEAKKRIAEIKKEFHDSRHSPFAYVVNNGKIERYSDDGEPSQSSGPPILNHIKGKELINVLVIVIRYFGGIKLGIGGLIRAYGSSAKLVIESADIIPFVLYERVEITYDYNHTNYVMHIIDKYGAEVIENSYTDKGKLVVKIKEEIASSFIDEIKNPVMPDIKASISKE